MGRGRGRHLDLNSKQVLFSRDLAAHNPLEFELKHIKSRGLRFKESDFNEIDIINKTI